MKHLLVLPDGTEIYSGADNVNNIRSASIKDFANSGTELTLGSVCASMLTATLQIPGGNLLVAAGDEVTLYSVDDAGVRKKTGIFVVQEPTWPSANILKITAYDRVCRLDKDLSAWLNSLTGWPYPMLTFAEMVCTACGVTLTTTQIPNGNYPVPQFQSSGATGRKLLGWIGELAARFVRATAEGNLEFAWYKPSAVTLSASGAGFRSLTYQDYQVAPIDTVQVRLADNAYGVCWPEAPAGANAYVLTGNPFITAINNDIIPRLAVIRQELTGVTYTPCKAVIPATDAVHAGDIVHITDRNGVTFTTYVMAKSRKGQLDTLECTGSQRRDSSMPANNPSAKDLMDYANQASTSAVKLQTQLDIFNKLTNNGQAQGLFLNVDGQVYVNATYINSGILNASLITAGILQSKDDGKTFRLDLDTGDFSMNGTGKFLSSDGKSYITLEGTEFVLYAQAGENGKFVDIARIGYTEDSEGYDYPYMLMGSTESTSEEFDKLGLYKMFRNGVWIGNSAPRYSTGSFVGLVGAAGIFIDTLNAAAYVVNGMDMEELYHGTVDATFA